MKVGVSERASEAGGDKKLWAATRRKVPRRVAPHSFYTTTAPGVYLNLKFARRCVPSFSVTTNWRQVPSHAFSVFQL